MGDTNVHDSITVPCAGGGRGRDVAGGCARDVCVGELPAWLWWRAHARLHAQRLGGVPEPRLHTYVCKPR
jgi:hypothetical protein